ncbi:hypothetical protein [Rheinheimera sp.]|uniref:hypothetical protein n=1 Tax=Rheinheimera sp. TaxID=1869214 RepID=UPI002FDE6D53
MVLVATVFTPYTVPFDFRRNIGEICNRKFTNANTTQVKKSHLTFIFAAFLVACSSSGNKKLLNSVSIQSAAINIVEIDYSKLKDINVDLESLGYNGDSIAFSMQQAQVNAAQSAGAAGAGAGFVGALIGGAIVQNAAVSAAVKEKNERVPQLLAKMRALDYQKLWQSSQFAIQKDAKGSNVSGLKMMLSPKVSLTADYQSFLITVEVDIREGDKSKYRNYFYLQSSQIIDLKQGLPSLEQKNSEWIAGVLQKTMQVLPQLIELDIAKGRDATANTAIRFENQMGQYYEHGALLQKHPTHLTFKTLRGEVKHLPYERLL